MNEKNNKTPCPIENCKTECTYPHNMVTHIIGMHVKKDHLLFDKIIKDVNEVNEDSMDKEFKEDLLERLEIREPEFTSDDEANCRTNLKIESVFDLDNYFNIENPICREERQYAHFLATKLEQNDENIVGKLRNELGFSTIVQVYFECTFMRDYWCANKEKYNKKLKLYLKEKKQINEWETEKENKETNHPNYWEKSHPYARWMTNAKPDIGLFVKNDKEKYTLHFLECKYLSEEDIYIDKKNEVKPLEQTKVQKMILEFLCSEKNGLGMKYGGKPIAIAVGKDVKLVRFVNGKKANEGEIPIEISDLI